MALGHGVGRRPDLFRARAANPSSPQIIYKTPRERAESHFSKTPSPSTAGDRVLEERDAIKTVQHQKDQRLRGARLARDGLRQEKA